jgi:hypothetical protein
MRSKTLALILAGIFIILTALFVWLFQDWVRSAIVVPVYYLFWLVSKILNSVDQQILWTILFLLALGAIGQTLFARSRLKATPLETEGKSRGQGRVIYWLIYVNLMLKGVYNRSYFSEELKRLILSVMALHERQMPIEIEKRIVSGDLVVPPRSLPCTRAQDGGHKQHFHKGLSRWSVPGSIQSNVKTGQKRFRICGQ